MTPTRSETLLCTWSSEVHWQQMHDDGQMQWNHDILPPFVALRKRATQIANGALAMERFRIAEDGNPEFWTLWRDLTKYNPGELNLDGKIGSHGHLEWWCSHREAGDPDSYGFSGHYMAPDFALASFIAHAEEHHREFLSERLEVVGGIA